MYWKDRSTRLEVTARRGNEDRKGGEREKERSTENCFKRRKERSKKVSLFQASELEFYALSLSPDEGRREGSRKRRRTNFFSYAKVGRKREREREREGERERRGRERLRPRSRAFLPSFSILVSSVRMKGKVNPQHRDRKGEGREKERMRREGERGRGERERCVILEGSSEIKGRGES